MRIDPSRALKEFSALVSIDSPSFGEKQMGDYLKKELASLGLSVRQDRAGDRIHGNCGNIHAFLEGTAEGEPLLFCAHMDTVEPSRGKRAVVSEDGTVTSDGKTVLGADDCAGLAAILEALRTLREKKLPHRPVEVLFTVAEEPYCRGAEQFDFSTLRSREAYVLDLAGPVGGAAYGAPTILSFTAEVLGKTAHAGFAPQDGIHAIAAAAAAVNQLRMGRVDPDTTLNVGTISGGTATNIVPDRCIATGEIRSYSHKKALEQAELVKKAFEDCARKIGASVKFESLCGCEAYETPTGHPVVLRFRQACARLGLPVSLEKTFGGSDNNHLAKHGIAGIVIATAMNRCHSCEEYTTAQELGRAAELTLCLMTE